MENILAALKVEDALLLVFPALRVSIIIRIFKYSNFYMYAFLCLDFSSC